MTRLGSVRFTDATATAGIRPAGSDIELLFNRKFFATLATKDLAGVLLHEALHFVFRHIQRGQKIRKQADRFLFRLACEAVINDSIKAFYAGISLPGNPITGDDLVGHNVAGFSADQVMALLRDRLDKDPAARITIASMEETDDHDTWDTASDDRGGWTDGTDQVLASVLKQVGARDVIGDSPWGANRTISSRRIRKDLRHFLEEYLRPSGRFMADWSRPNRKAAALFPRVILPTWKTMPEPGHILMAIDASGSVSPPFLDAFVQLAEQKLPGNRVTFISFDTEPYVYEKGSGKVQGNGGTRVQAVEDYITAHLERYPDIVFVFTDGDTPPPSPSHPDRWIWILTPDGKTAAIPGHSRIEFFEC